MFSWFHIMPTGRRVRRKRQVGTLDQYKTEAAAERAVRSWRLAINSNEACAFSGITMQDLIDHFRLKELDSSVEQGAGLGLHATAMRPTSRSGLSRGGASTNSLRSRLQW